MISASGRSDLIREDGAILPLVAILMLVLLGFAAFAVDAAGAYAERRQAQSAADAGVMAGALVYLDPGSATGQSVADQVMLFVGMNAPGTPPTAQDWAACEDATRPGDYEPLKDANGVSISDCISLKQVSGAPALLRVRTPNWNMPTAFAGIIGFDTVAISATATAELRYLEAMPMLPFSLPADSELVECLATPPEGHLPDDDDTVDCDGPDSGNFGLLDSPWFGAGDPHFTQDRACPDNPSFNERARHNIAYGLDHVITTWPTPPAAPEEGYPVRGGRNHPGADDCANAQSGVIPYVMRTQTGNRQRVLHDGFLGDDPSVTAGTKKGKFRQPSSPASSGARLIFETSTRTFDVDNVGLWEYLTNTENPSDECDITQFDNQGSNARVGRELTEQLMECLEDSYPVFSADLLTSPRFAIAPVLNYEDDEQRGKKWWAVTDLRPVFLQTTWYHCTGGRNKECLFQPDDITADPSDRETYSVFFNPGEGSASPCYLRRGVCETPRDNKFKLMGLSAIVLAWDQVPAATNQFGGDAPFEVWLHTNE